MEKTELRIGNLISYKGEKEGYVSSIGNNGFETCRTYNDMPFGSDEYDDYEGIPLTEEKLVKFGFIKDSIYLFYSLGNFIIRHDFILCDIGIRVYIQYVHQLQNLYFALTGEELKIKES